VLVMLVLVLVFPLLLDLRPILVLEQDLD